MSAEKLLTVKDLSISFGTGKREVAAVERISFNIAKGETLFGRPEAMYWVGRWVVLEYRANLLSEIQPVAS